MILQRASNRRLVKLSRKVFAREISSPKEPTWFQRSKWAPRSGQTWIADLVQDANNSGAEKSRIQESEKKLSRAEFRIAPFLTSWFLNSCLLDRLAIPDNSARDASSVKSRTPAESNGK